MQAPPTMNRFSLVVPDPQYDPLGGQEETRVVDPDTLVKNLKTNKLEVRERIFVDKPVHKQLEITMEEKQGITQISQLQRQATGGLAALTGH